MKYFLLLPILLILGACSTLSVGEYDDEGNYTPPADVERVYTFPVIHSGLVYTPSNGRIRGCLDIELFEFELPYLGVMDLNIGVAEDYGFFSLNKQWTSIFELESGVTIGYDLEEHDWLFGFSFVLTRF